MISNLDGKDDQRSIVSALLALSEKLGIEALAEGAETESEVEALRNLGCTSVQGYAFARPMPENDLRSWMEDRGRQDILKSGA